MAALKEARSYGLSCGRVSDGSRVSVFHVKLTDSALRAFESYRACQGTSSLRPSIQFQGSQGHICIPQPDGATESRTFSFYLTNVGRDGPQGSFDCIQQYVSSHGDEQLDYLGSVQDKITVCATDDSYQKARQSLAQAEEETRSRSAIVIKPGGRYLGKRVQFRKPAPGATEAVPSRKRATPISLASAVRRGGAGSVAHRPFRDRVLHLLALRPYRKAELLLRLQRDGLAAADRDALDGLLQQLANVDARDGACTLKDSVYRDVQRDWPGYSEGDQQLLKRVLVRKLLQPQGAGALSGESASTSPSREHDRSASPLQIVRLDQKRPPPPDFIDPLAPKKPRISHFTQRTQPIANGKLSAPHSREALLPTPGPLATMDTPLPPRLEPPRAHDPLADVSNDLGHSGRDCERREVAGPAPSAPPACASPSRALGPARSKAKKRSKKHRLREREVEAQPHAQPPALAPDAPGLNGTCSSSNVPTPTSTSETPDYLLKYAPIVSSEQRQSYKNDFNAEYTEYRGLHARIEHVTRRFTQLDAQLRQLTQGSTEYETTRGQILQEYRKIKKTNTNYSQEKRRCEYLHSKLAHIKRLIAEYDQRQLHAWP